jgi:cation/acetate symporter
VESPPVSKPQVSWAGCGIANCQKSQEDYEKNKDGTSVIGLDKPLFPLKNPAIVSVLIGFAAAIFFALLLPSKRGEDAFDESCVRQNTGIGTAEA